MIKPIEPETLIEELPFLDHVKFLLLTREAISLDELTQALEIDRPTARQHLDHFLHRNQIERLAPVRFNAEEERDDEEFPARHVFYRWRRRGDQDHVWQKRLVERQRLRTPPDHPPFSEHEFDLDPHNGASLILRVLHVFLAQR